MFSQKVWLLPNVIKELLRLGLALLVCLWTACSRHTCSLPYLSLRATGWETLKTLLLNKDVCPRGSPHMGRIIGCFLQSLKSESERHSVMSDSLRSHGLYSPWNSPGQNTGLGSLSLLQGIYPTQKSNPDLPHCRQIFYQLSHQGSPRILEGVAYPFSSRSSQSRNWTGVSHIAGGFFTKWAIRESLKILIVFKKGK